MNTVLKSMRPSFLLLTPICVLLGGSFLAYNQIEVNIFYAFLATVGALFAHISVNTLNEYTDFKSGLDLMTKRTDFSGGSGALPDNPHMLNWVLLTGVVSLLLTSFIGLFFVWQFGLAILPIGLVGILLVITYTRWINRIPWLCLISPGLGFGVLMVVGTQFILTGYYTLQSFVIALVPFFLINNLLLLNQYPDIEADKKVGRNHFPIAFGIDRSNVVYGLFAIATVVVISIGIYLSYLPAMAVIAFIPMPLALLVWLNMVKHKESIASYPQFLAANVATSLLVPLLLAISLMISEI